ncbi:hypothetical protein TIFTF001_053214 [Ficus carica]|uniref:Uncharacterized protein n=1 Tax=Ficus carica TaxID=3494 RepID=A0AA88EPG5_FICCA|nr:hypothetical protein TIFTF001_053214 [Ficus carica]
MLKSVTALPADPGVQVTRSGRSPSSPVGEPQPEQVAEVGDGIRAVAGYASDVRRRIECCDRAPPPIMYAVPRAWG